MLRALRHVQKPPIPVPDVVWRAFRLPAWRVLWLGGVGLMSPGLRRRLAIGWHLLDEVQFRAIGAVSRGLSPVMPAGLKAGGPEQWRLRRAAIAEGTLGTAAGDSPARQGALGRSPRGR